MLLKAENINVQYSRLENEVIPLGATKIEVVLAEIPIDELKLDPTNPRIQFQLQALGTVNPEQDELRELLWEMEEVKRLKRSIQANGGLIEAVIVSGKDGTVYEGNCRLTCFFKLRDETNGSDSRWTHIRARILPPEVTRETVDVLLGELHIAGKNKWSAFEQAAHLYNMYTRKGYDYDTLTQMYRQSKGYISAKIRAYKLMADCFVPMARERKKEIKDLAGYWSWFEEFYKRCKPSAPGRENSERVYDGKQLEEKFCEWVLEGKLPVAEDVRKLPEILTDNKATKTLETESMEKSYNTIVVRKPALASALWKQIDLATSYLQEMPIDEIDAIREGDMAKANMFDALVKAVERIKKEIKK